jgi:predicted dehydrogenase
MKMNIIVIGAGMYVCGKGTDEFGTILPALFEWKRSGFDLGQVHVCGTTSESAVEVEKRATILSKKFNEEIQIFAYPLNEKINTNTYLSILNQVSKPVCAIVVVPDHLHYKIIIECLKKGIHTLVVKPLVTKIQDAKELILFQKKYNIYGAVEYHKRFDRSNQKLKEVINNGRIGEPLYFIVEYSQRKTIPTKIFSQWVEKTNIFQYLGIHYVDIIYFSTHAKPLRVMATGQYGFLRDNGINAFDAVHGTVEWKAKNGNIFYSYIFTNWIDPDATSAMSDQKIKVIGTKGRYEADQKYRGIKIVSDDNGTEEVNPDFCSSYVTSSGAMSYKGYGIESIHTFINDVICLYQNRCTIKELEGKRPTFKDAIPSTAVIEGINKSLDNNGSWESVVY